MTTLQPIESAVDQALRHPEIGRHYNADFAGAHTGLRRTDYIAGVLDRALREIPQDHAERAEVEGLVAAVRATPEFLDYNTRMSTGPRPSYVMEGKNPHCKSGNGF